MNNNSLENKIDVWDIYRRLPEKVIINDRNIFDFDIVKTCGEELVVIWSEYYPGRNDEVTIYSYSYNYEGCQKLITISEGDHVSPYITTTSGTDCKIHLLLTRSLGVSTELLLKTYNGTSWKTETKIINIESATFGHKIVASQKREKFYVILGDYREWHTFPYILTAIFTGHTGREFGKLFLIEGNGVSWTDPRKITKTGRFSTLNPSICLNDEMDILHIVWEDERTGYWNRTIYYDSFDGHNFSGNKRICGNIRRASLPSIACDNNNNIYAAWSTFDNHDSYKLYLRERLNNSWRQIVELSSSGIMNIITTDNLGNVHFVWDDGSQIYYKIKTESFWTKTTTFIGNKAKITIDKKNNVHVVLLRREKERKCSLIYNRLEYEKGLP